MKKQTEAKTDLWDCITTDTGRFKPGIQCRIVAGGERTVYLGSEYEKTVLPDFVLCFTDSKGRKTNTPYCLYGKDFVFANNNNGRAVYNEK